MEGVQGASLEFTDLIRGTEAFENEAVAEGGIHCSENGKGYRAQP